MGVLMKPQHGSVGDESAAERPWRGRLLDGESKDQPEMCVEVCHALPPNSCLSRWKTEEGMGSCEHKSVHTLFFLPCGPVNLTVTAQAPSISLVSKQLRLCKVPGGGRPKLMTVCNINPMSSPPRHLVPGVCRIPTVLNLVMQQEQLFTCVDMVSL